MREVTGSNPIEDIAFFGGKTIQLFHLVVGEDLHSHSLLSNPIDLSIKYLK
jgi:hypothetical protein